MTATVTSEQVRELIEHLGRLGLPYLPKSSVLPISQPRPEGDVAVVAQAVAPTGPSQGLSVAGGEQAKRLGTVGAAVSRAVELPADRPGTPVGIGGRATTGVAGGGVSSGTATPAGQTLLPVAGPYPGEPLGAAARVARLNELAAEVAGCHRCESLATCRRNTVFGEGDPEARICFFGEAPGQEEDATGRPFVGASGQLLTRMIEACTLSREQVYILNTIKCRPPNNRNPDVSERENCRAFYEAQFRTIRPEYIVCLGLVAAQTLLNTTLSIGRMRGRFHRYHDSKVLVTYHPSYLLRTPAAKREAWNDLKLLMADAGIDLNRR